VWSAELGPELLAVAEYGGLDAARGCLNARDLGWIDNPQMSVDSGLSGAGLSAPSYWI
jgi:hypothetical protein